MVPIRRTLRSKVSCARPFEITWRDDLFLGIGHRPTVGVDFNPSITSRRSGSQTSHDGSFPLAFAGVISVGRPPLPAGVSHPAEGNGYPEFTRR